MRNGKHSLVFLSLRRRVISLGLALIFIVASIVVMLFINVQEQHDTTKIIQVLGQQRMRTQDMAKNANRISVIQTAMDSPNRLTEMDVLKARLIAVQADLINSKNKYKQVNRDLENGYVQTDEGIYPMQKTVSREIAPKLDEIDRIWAEFEPAVVAVSSGYPEEVDFKEGLITINTHNEALLDYSNRIVLSIEEALNERYAWYRVITLVLVGIFVMMSGLALFQLYHYLFRPLDALYTGFNSLGFSNDKKTYSRQSVKEVREEVEALFEGVKETMRLTEQINTNLSFNETLNYIYKTFNRYVPYTYIGIAIYKEDDPTKLVASYGISDGKHEDLANALLGYESQIKETSLKQVAFDGEPRVINDLEGYLEGRQMRTHSRILLENGIRSSITLSLETNGKRLGFIFFSSNKKNVYKDRHIEYLRLISNSIAISFQKNIFIDDLLYSSVMALVKLSEARDEDTADHLVRMKRYCTLLARIMMGDPRFKAQIDTQFIMDIEKFSPMHDIGKVGIPDSILLKPGKLTVEEFEVMKTHASYGAEVLREAEKNIKRSGRSMFSMGIGIAIAHHEKWDGSGYPHGLAGEVIPLSARIVALADVLDALLSRRPYKEPIPFQRAVEMILEGRGTHFDPRIIEIFEENIEQFRQEAGRFNYNIIEELKN